MQAEVARDHELSLIRRAVESLFGPMKHSYCLAPMRAFTRLRNMTDLTFFCLAFNLRRWLRQAAPYVLRRLSKEASAPGTDP